MIRAASEKQVAADEIANILGTLYVGEVLPYQRIDNLMMGDRGVLRKAMRLANDRYGFVFGTVYRVGVKRLSERTVIFEADYERTRKLMGRVEKTGTNSLIHEAASLSREEKFALTKHVNACGAIKLAVKQAKG